MATGDFLDIAQRACRLARRDETLAAQITLAKEAINEGYAQVLADSDEWNFLYREGTVTLVANTDTRTLTQFDSDLALAAGDDIEELVELADDTNGNVLIIQTWRSLENLIRTTQSNNAAGFTAYWALSSDRTVRFYPRPQSDFSLRISYRLRPGLMTTDAAFPVIPAPHAAVVLEHYAAWKLLLQDSGGEALAEADRHLAIHERAKAILMKQEGTARNPNLNLVEPAAFYDLPDYSYYPYGGY